MPRNYSGIALAVACAGGLAACTGAIEGQSTGPSGVAAGELIPARIRRLTNAEYDASVQALLGTKQALAATTFPPDSRQANFTMNDAQRVDPVLATQLDDAAQALVAEARSDGNLAGMSPCADP